MQQTMSHVSKMVHDRVSPSNPQTMSIDCGGNISTMAQNRDATQVVVGGRSVFKIYSVYEDGFEEKFNLRGGRPVNLNYCALDIAWNHTDENILATGATNGAVVIWDLNMKTRCKQEHVFTQHKRTVNRVCFHDVEHRTLLSASQDGQMNLFDLRKREVAANFSVGSTSVRDINFCPHNYFNFASADEAGTVMIWDMRKPNICEKKLTAHNGPVFTINWHPEDKNWLATAGRDRLIKVWDLSRNKVLHTVYSIASLSRIKWRPQRKYHIASCSLLIDFNINIWDIRRPYVPFATFDMHKDATTSMMFKNKDPHVMLSASKDSYLYQHVFRDAKRPAEDLVPAGLGISVQGIVGHANSDRQGKLSTMEGGSSRSYFNKRSTDKNDQFVDVMAYMEVFNETGQELHSWVEMAQEYELTGKPVEELCTHNSSVARSHNMHHISQAWQALLVLYSASMPVCTDSKHPSQTRTFSVLSVTPAPSAQEKTDNDKGKAAKEPKTDTDVDERTCDGTSGNSDDEGDLQELSDIKLASIARGQVNPDWDILFGDGEPGAEDFFMGPATVKKKDWSLPHEAFFPRHEIHDRETPFESLTDSNHFYDSTVDYEPPSNLPTSKTVETTQLTRLSVDTSLLSCPDWGYTDSIVSLLKDLAAEGDVQTPVTMLIVMKDQIRAHIDTDLQEDWFMSYLELLGRFKLWSIANHVIKLSNLPGIFMLNQQSTTIHVNCNMCNRLLTRSGWLCDRCKMITNVCSICCQPVKGMFLWCQGCSHGGHMQHIKDWLLQSNECPKGCGHICEYT
ncbi:GATOR complex protein WDR24-like isoform X2 [Dreissena polymorpha]|uniref:GATOR complex protein WDR24-like isoform X2 n=1 Tax=Dreissena polymorpha TaxID=45954 RepID=UPI002264160B|nr:GATOR complex protein WDR24-like isoform X2 [Dreissena polymorpha]